MDDVTPTGMPKVEAAWRLCADLWDFGVELALTGIMDQESCSRDEALRILDARIRDEVRRDTPAMLRIAKALHGE
jgi:hypothetical protein